MAHPMEDETTNQRNRTAELQEIANTIKEQIGNHCLVMIGAKNLLYGIEPETEYPFLIFNIGRNRKGIWKIKIILDQGKDTYIFKTYNYKGKEIDNIDDVFCDSLNPLIALKSGLATSLN